MKPIREETKIAVKKLFLSRRFYKGQNLTSKSHYIDKISL